MGRLVIGGAQVRLAVDDRLQLERGPDREEDGSCVERGEDPDAGEATQRLEAQQQIAQRGMSGTDVASAELRRLERCQFLDESVRHRVKPAWENTNGA